MKTLSQTTYNEVKQAMPEMPGEGHLACVLLLDTSGSMTCDDSIKKLMEGVRAFIDKTCLDSHAKNTIDVAIIEFNDSARLIRDFTPIGETEPVHLTATGCTAMGAAINMAIDKAKERTHFYTSIGTPHYAPWIVMITDGAPTDDITLARQRILSEEQKGSHGHLKFWAVGVPGYDRDTMKSLTKRCIELSDNSFDKFFNWLSESMVIVSESKVGETVNFGLLPDNARMVPAEAC